MREAGLRLQIVLAVCGLMALAFIPLFFALASLTRVALHGADVEAAQSLGRAVAEHAADLPAPDSAALERLIAGTSVGSLCVKRPSGDVCVGQDDGHGVEVTVPRGNATVVARVHTRDSAQRAAPLVRLYAGYTTAFALALAFLVYVALTRLIVKPVEALARATDRVATGARQLELPRSGARELAELSASVGAMTTRLIADEEALRKKVAELTEAQAQVIRSERMASVGRLAAGMAHEIGNPITAMMGLQDLMLGGDVSPADQGDYVARMRKETERVHRILRDLLDFARPESADSHEMEPGPAHVGEVMRDVVALLSPQKGFRDVAITVEGGEIEARIAADRLTQVLLNLGLNAGEAMGGAGKLVLRARADGSRAHIEVEDTGPGVPASLGDRLFLPFVTTKEVGQGTGLGLAVCRGIVEAAGGRITLDSTYAHGARFVVELPLHPLR